MASSSNGPSDVHQQNIRGHWLFPLLAYLSSKCDEAMTLFAEKSFDTDELRDVILGLRVSRTEDKELNSFMWDAIMHLRHQLYEINKVNDLCNDFMRKYSVRLKVHFAQESSSICSFSPDFDEEDSTSSSFDYAETSPSSTAAGASTAETDKRSAPPIATIQTKNGPISIALYNHYPVSLCNNEDNNQEAISKAGHDDPSSSTLLSKSPDSNNENVSSVKLESKEEHNDWSKSKRSSLPKKSVNILKSWLFQNISHPYPSEDEKRQLSTDAGLNLIQVNNWFINARRRILQPLLTDGSYSSIFNSLSKHSETSPSAIADHLDQESEDAVDEAKDSAFSSNLKKFCSNATQNPVYSVDNLL